MLLLIKQKALGRPKEPLKILGVSHSRVIVQSLGPGL